MEKPRLEVVVVPSGNAVCRKRRLSDFEDDQPVSKVLRMASPVHPMEWDPCPEPYRGFLASSLACPPARLRPPSTQLQKKTPRRVPYDPNDFTSDELDPAFEWPREPPLPRKCDVEVILLQSILRHFPLGLRLEKLVTMMWKEHKVHLWKMSMERGYRNILQFLEEVPGVRLTVTKGGARYLVHMF